MNIPAALVSVKGLVGNKHKPVAFAVPVPGAAAALSFSKLLSDQSATVDRIRPSNDQLRPPDPVKRPDPRDAIKDRRDQEPRANTAYGDNQSTARKDDTTRTSSTQTAADSKVATRDGQDGRDAAQQAPTDAKSTKPGSAGKSKDNQSKDTTTSTAARRADNAKTSDGSAQGAVASPATAEATAAKAKAAAAKVKAAAAKAAAKANGQSEVLTATAGAAAATQVISAVQLATTGNRNNAKGDARTSQPRRAASIAALAKGATSPSASAAEPAQGKEAAAGLLNATQSAAVNDGATATKRELAQLVAKQQAGVTAKSGKAAAPGKEQSRRATPASDRSFADLVAGRTGSRSGGPPARAGHPSTAQPSQPQTPGGPQGQPNATGAAIAAPVTAHPQGGSEAAASKRILANPLKVDGSAQNQNPAAAGNGGATATNPLRAATQARAAQQATATIPAAEQVAVRVQKAIAEGNDRILIRLKPAALGRVDVKLEVTHDGRVTAVVTADNSSTLNLLRQDFRGLTQALQNAGLKADSNSLSFNLQSGNHGGAGTFGGGFQNNGGTAGNDNMPFAADHGAEIAQSTTPYRVLGNGLLDIHV